MSNSLFEVGKSKKTKENSIRRFQVRRNGRQDKS
jgi:hypothetical protein